MIIVLLVRLLDLYGLILFVRILMSWVNPDPYNPIMRFLRSATDPILLPLRRIIPPIGGMIDISPMIALLLIHLLKRMLISTIVSW